MVKLAHILNSLRPAKVLVIGDMFLDTYTIGKAKRISPEAPVAIVNVLREEHRPGGSGNVILNLLSLGVQVVAIGRVGRDAAGRVLMNALKRENVDTQMIVFQKGYRTTIKNRIMADNQQMVRVDHEDIIPLDPSLERTIIARLPFLLEGMQVVAISDYGKGFLVPSLLAAIIHHANRKGIPVITDPKGHDFNKYRGTTIIKPNQSEALAAANLTPSASLEEVACTVLQQTEARLLMVTRSEAGISLFGSDGGRSDFPVDAKQVKDVTGAGDTVLAVLAHAVANQLPYDQAAQLCNVAAGIAIEQAGCARVSLSDLAFRLFEHNMSHKVFDQEHLFVLQEVLKRKPFSLVVLSQVSQLTHGLFLSIKKIAAKSEAVLVFIDDAQPGDAFIELLASLQEISFIILHAESLQRLNQCAKPHSIYIFDPDLAELKAVDGLS